MLSDSTGLTANQIAPRSGDEKLPRSVAQLPRAVCVLVNTATEPRPHHAAPLRNNTAPHRSATTPHRAAPLRNNTAPRRAATTPRRAATAPQQHRTAPHRAATTPRRTATAGDRNYHSSRTES
jgi:hypothetical protein